MDSEATETCGLNDLHFVHNRRLVVGSVAHVVISYAAGTPRQNLPFTLSNNWISKGGLPQCACPMHSSVAEFSGSSQTLGMENEDEMWRGLEISL